ncbi:uncharacterized protein [Chironomus tepperi]|uniref:uncharacterized protein n=1 Tax=Chironomus tepperi TaxID=113505 RepID=UPI00391F4AEC
MVKEYTKSLSNTSTTSVDSGIFDVDLTQSDDNATDMTKDMSIGEAVKKILTDAKSDNRLIFGVKDAIKHFNETENPEHSLFFFMAPNSAEKLSRIINSDGASCALVQRSDVINDVYNKFETILIDHCEDFWDEVVQPIIRLPEK